MILEFLYFLDDIMERIPPIWDLYYSLLLPIILPTVNPYTIYYYPPPPPPTTAGRGDRVQISQQGVLFVGKEKIVDEAPNTHN